MDDKKKKDLLKDMRKKPFLRFSDHKIANLQEGFLETDCLEEFEHVTLPTEPPKVCDDGTTPITDDLFVIAEHDSTDAERIGYSNYSYWRSTFRVFFKKKISVFLLVFLFLLLAFTFIQPLLPNQKDSYLVYNDENGNTLRNIPPNEEFWFGTNSIGQDLWARIWGVHEPRCSLASALQFATW